MGKLISGNAAGCEVFHRAEHPGYEFFLRRLAPRSDGSNCNVGLYEVPPGMSSYPYHYHVKNEEFFYVLSGEGVLRTPQGEQPVKPGDYFYFPPDADGAHKITNTSDSQPLVYLDFDVCHDLEVCFYPDSEKIGVYGKDLAQLYLTKDQVEYYQGE